MTIYGCSAVKCVRRSKDFKTLAGFEIERSCPHKDSNCPEAKSYTDRVINNVQDTSIIGVKIEG